MEPGYDGGDEPVGGTGEENIAGGGQMAGKGTEEQVGGRQTADKGTGKEKQTGGKQTAGDDGDGSKKAEESEPRKKCSTQSITKLWEKKRQSVMKEQEWRWKEATEKRDTISTEVDLEDAMMSPEEEDKQVEEKERADVSEGYEKVYTKMHEMRGEQSISRAEKKAQGEQQRKDEEACKAAKAQVDKCAQDEAQRLIEKQQLEAEEMAVQRRIDKKRELEEQVEKDKEKEDLSKSSKQQWKEKLGLKAKKRRRDEDEEAEERKAKKQKKVDEEEAEDIEDEDNDPDYMPDDDPEQEFETEDMELNEEDTFEIEKHIHAINLQEAGDYMVEIRIFVTSFGKVVRKAKEDVARKYRKLIHFMREMVLKVGSYGPVEHADEEAVFRTIVDPTCTTWK